MTEPDPVEVPAEWEVRGFTGRYHQRWPLTPDAAETLAVLAPCLLDTDPAWLVLDVGLRHGTVGGRWEATMVRLDTAATLDLAAAHPPPGAYRRPGA